MMMLTALRRSAAILVALCCFILSETTCGQAVAIYDATSGNVTLQGGPTLIGEIWAQGPGVPISATPDDFGNFVLVEEDKATWLFFRSAVPPLLFIDVFPAGLSHAELQEMYVLRALHPGSAIYPPPVIPWEYVAVPEPSVGVMAALCVVGALAARNSRRARA